MHALLFPKRKYAFLFLKKKCIVCREKTERVEGLGTFAFMCEKPDQLESLFQKVNSDYKIDLPSPYGDGFSSKRIVEILLSEI